MDLKNKVAIVTGASSGLGSTLAVKLTSHGATVFGLARRKEKLDKLTAEIGDSFIPVICDVTSEDSISEAFETCRSQAASIDLLINNAGLGRFDEIESASTADFDLQSDTNVRGVFLCSREVIPVMKQQNKETGFGGHIVNVASIAGLIGNAGLGVYNATKFAVRGMSEAMMKELRKDGIKVSCIFPGTFETEFFETAGVQMAGSAMTADAVADTVMHIIQGPDNYLISEVTMRPLRPNS